MFIKQIMNRDVVSVKSGDSVQAAASIMSEREIGCLLVVDKILAGIVTERDILKKIVALNRNPSKIPVGEIMTRKVIYISPDSDISEAVSLFNKHRIKRLPVVLGDDVVGIITNTDIVKAEPNLLEEIYSF